MRAITLLVAVALTVAGCGGSTGSTGSTVSPAGTPSTGAVASGWTVVRAQRLTFAVPAGMTRSAVNIPEAVVTYRGQFGADKVPPPAAAAFVEHGHVGPLGIRTELLVSSRTAQLGAPPIGPSRSITVPGALGATVTEWQWDYQVPGAGAVPSRQVEVVIETSGPEQYGAMFGGPKTFMTDEVLAGFLSSLRIGAGDV